MAGRDAWRRDQRDEAERCFRAALAALQQLEPLDAGIGIDSRLADGFRQLAMLHGKGGAFALMAAAIDDARASIVRQGPDAPAVLDRLTRLAELYLAIGGNLWGTAGGYWYRIGVNLHERVREVREKVLGPEHLLFAESLETVAPFYHGDGSGPLDYHALKRYHRALEIRERALGQDHPDVARSLENCAGYNDADYHKGSTDAEILLQRALRIRESAFGLHHPAVARSKECLARHLARIEDRNVEAEALAREALAIREETQGLYHPDVAGTLQLLAELHHGQAKLGDAERVLVRAISILLHAAGLDQFEAQQEIFEIVALQTAGGARHFERLSVTEDAAQRLTLFTHVDTSMKSVVPPLVREPVGHLQVLATLGCVQRPGSTTIACLATVFSRLEMLVTHIGGKEEEAGPTFEEVFAPYHRQITMCRGRLAPLYEDYATSLATAWRHSDADAVRRQAGAIGVKLP